ncbi:MAG: 30S ribosomal protein S9 [Proteobacteria bacterium]|jgi:small subunit ribosomal protein S9|nr:30S ribosomal protein S9 [Pseudomonadota bacterium]
MAAEKVFYATGRRKTSAARVFLKPGKGNLTINGLKSDDYLKRMQSKMVILQPFDTVNQLGKFDVDITVAGGGENGQTGAIRLGIARALTAFSAEFRPLLKKAGFLTRDQRAVERKKYGLRGARRRGQYSKR